MQFLSVFFLAFSMICPCLAMAPSEGLQKLLEGNKRYVHDKLEHPNRGLERRESISQKQNPFAVIVGCSDSRVPPELIFDQGLGDIFAVRTAGNVVSLVELDSVEYAIKHLGAVIVIVLGHENCGAVAAVVQEDTSDIPTVAKLIQPAVLEAKKNNPSSLLTSSIEANAQAMAKQLANSAVLQESLKAQRIAIYPAYYHLKSGEIKLLTNTP